jgi:hypothetical protein
VFQNHHKWFLPPTKITHIIFKLNTYLLGRKGKNERERVKRRRGRKSNSVNHFSEDIY